jgi:hypothetical protein
MSKSLNEGRSPQTSKNNADTKRPMLWGTFYIILGIIGLIISVYTMLNSTGIVPLFGTVTTGALMGVLSIFMIIYGYGIIKRDF